MVYDSQKLRRKRVEQLEYNETFEPDFVQISKSYILQYWILIFIYSKEPKRMLILKGIKSKLFLPAIRDWIENIIFSQRAQSIIQILIVMLAEERLDRILAQQWVAEKMAFFSAVKCQLPPPPLIFW